MDKNQKPERLRLRPHHVFCERFSPWSVPERGGLFVESEHRIRETLRSGTDTLVEVIEGVDRLCQACPLCRDDGCQSPEGNEDAVRKWDGFILKDLGIAYGDRMTAQGLRMLIDEKAPLPFCRTRCRLRDGCNVFHLG